MCQELIDCVLAKTSKHGRRTWQITIAILSAAACVLFACYLYVDSQTNSLVYTIETAPYSRVGLVLGTSRARSSGGFNSYYLERMRAAAELYARGKVKLLLLSGDNRSVDYNEPAMMKKDLMRMGVPESNIAMDFAGFDTYDSMIRAHKVWGMDSVMVISQDFHVRRAVYIGNRRGMYAVGVATREPAGWFSVAQLREVFARLKMLADVHILHSQPRYLGPKEIFPADTVRVQ